MRREQAQLLRLIECAPGYVDLSLARLSKRAAGVSGSGQVATVGFEAADQSSSRVIVEYELVSADHATLAQGVIAEHGPVETEADRTLSVYECIAGPNPATVAGFRAPLRVMPENLALSRVRGAGGAVLAAKVWIPRDVSSSDKLEVAVIIRDAVGNTVAAAGPENIMPALQGESGETARAIYWDCRNRNGRAVAPGVYEATLLWKTARGGGAKRLRIGLR
jgi:hypothetical protein